MDPFDAIPVLLAAVSAVTWISVGITAIKARRHQAIKLPTEDDSSSVFNFK